MKIRDRVKELRRVRAGSLIPHPKNWRKHPEQQQDALRGILAEIGYADALLVRELPDGSLQLIDGHLRAETTPELEVPVLVVDLNDTETAKLLAVLDPLASMAEADHEILTDLISQFETESDAVQRLINEMLDDHDPIVPFKKPEHDPEEIEIPESFQVVVECPDEESQKAIFERLIGEGYSCRLLML